MFSQLIQFSLSQRMMICLLALVLTGFGMQALVNLPIDAYPDISPTQVKIIIKAPGMTPEEVESLITQPLEVELLGIPQQDILRSITKYALSSITLDFDEGTDIYWARQQVTERINNVWEDLPAGISGGLAPMSTPLGDMFMFTIESDTLSLEEKRFLLDWTIRPALRTVPGVADVNALGGFVKTYEVMPRREVMAQLQVSNDDIVEALSTNNQNDGAGRINQGEEAILVRVAGAITTFEDIGNIQVINASGNHIPLSEIAKISTGSLERYGSVTADGNSEAVQGLVMGLRGANARDVVDGVKGKLDELQATLPEGTTTEIFYDRSVLIEGAIGTVSKVIIEAVILVVVLLALFLGNIRAALTVAIVLPMSALITFILMNMVGMSANLMSLGGLVIAIGMLVDASIVIVENIVSSLGNSTTGSKALPKLHIVFRAVKDVAVPVTSGILIIIIVFLPLLTLEGLEGKLFGPVTMTIVFALLGSLVLSLTLIPVIASFVIKVDAHDEPWLSRTLLRIYQPLLNKTINKPQYLFTMAAGLLIVTAAMFPYVGKTFMPTMDEGDIIIQLEFVPSINLETTTRMVQQVERAILEDVPDVIRVISRSGSDEIGMDPMGLNETDVFLQLKPANEWQASNKAELEEQLRAVLSQFYGINFGFTQPIDMRVSEMLTGSRGDVAIKLFGNNLNALNDYAQEIARQIQTVEGSIDTVATLNEGAQYLQISIDRLRAGQLGINADELQTRLRSEVEGLTVGNVIEDGARVPLVIRYSRLQGDGLDLMSNNFINLPDGNIIALSELAHIERVEGPVSISRESGQRFAVIRTNVEGRDLVGFVNEAQQAISDTIDLPEGYTVEWGGEFENQQRAAARLALVIPVALALIAFLLFLTFRSLKQTLIILSNIPFALTGGIIALWVTGEFLSVPASVGFIALLGIAVLNGVVMMSHFNYLLSKGMEISQVVKEGAARRFRPVMMTATICAFGLVPLLLATGPGSELQKPLAIVVIGGLISSTLLTLFLLPVIYQKFHSKQQVRTA
ncbi:MAG: CusA/CzcA family heavy metal efflux RND transporter [SAR86 cluster bacterium]|uniref:CusA/CzcA family heavy metal efflux RND transporter n=1 Tax=SAR86 cluster bacterium TaxID=2030880 RepID=A0A2A5CFY7_9GAMM|nr:efflux RND transporter permease subunit [Gammaproteobacteria bacterium AH-315-E17]PCJ42663.1 MAG: CusA/CzcA family heavy metal efflux RND transporter [SAR86 cluster bacterium]